MEVSPNQAGGRVGIKQPGGPVGAIGLTSVACLAGGAQASENSRRARMPLASAGARHWSYQVVQEFRHANGWSAPQAGDSWRMV